MGPDAGKPPRTGPWELYDLENDPTEIHDLAAQQPERVKAMAAAHDAWAHRVGVVPQEEIERALEEFRRNQEASKG
jgi:arylsulfatase